MADLARDILSCGAAELGVPLDDRQLDQFDTFTALLLKWNRKFNVTRITDPREIAVKHYLDSLSVLSAVEMRSDASVIDVGTGAGLPGIALKIALPGLRTVLLDSVKKKLVFVETAIGELGMSDVELVHARAEDAGRDESYREQFGFALSRAVAKLAVLAELCVPFCRVGGRFVAYKGPEVNGELSEARNAVRILGGHLERTVALALPHADARRTLVVIRKERHTSSRYPRRAGVPQKRPL